MSTRRVLPVLGVYRKRDQLAAEVATRLQALSGGQQAEARRILAAACGVARPFTSEAASVQH